MNHGVTSPKHSFVLYLFGESVEGSAALTNLKYLCDKHLGDAYGVEVVDLEKDLSVATEQDVFATPTVERRDPKPCVRVIGDLSDVATVIRHFGLDAHASRQGDTK